MTVAHNNTGCPLKFILDDMVLPTDALRATLGPEPVNIHMINCSLAPSQIQSGGGAVGLTMKGAVQESRALKMASRVLLCQPEKHLYKYLMA